MGLLSIRPFERLLKKAGAKRVSKEAAQELAAMVEEKLLEIASEAVTLARHAGRKTVVAEDIKLARRKLGL